MTTLFVRLGLVLGLLRDRLDTRSDRGATAVEYGLLIGIIAIGLIAILGVFNTAISGFFVDIAAQFSGAVDGE
ncbi:Flp family type IVb pilin [Desertihabitans brevis]|uniref:Flp family type IVb pilin n=1 Tax=Desertihabitans brevis TaxID=2268447 RepID=A0A367YTT5_9ACTN|nr:Flp family type IVb pilin [Desertihabitans brevis]RCK69303.1 Flp family type IVb pilin [Desertihabitans brevis]